MPLSKSRRRKGWPACTTRHRRGHATHVGTDRHKSVQERLRVLNSAGARVRRQLRALAVLLSGQPCPEGAIWCQPRSTTKRARMCLCPADPDPSRLWRSSVLTNVDSTPNLRTADIDRRGWSCRPYAYRGLAGASDMHTKHSHGAMRCFPWNRRGGVGI